MATGFTYSSAENPNKRIKTEDPILENSSSASLLSFKGKSKIEFESNCCGICLSESAQDGNVSVSRGCIDSCDHYFCFLCIMEWAKVESKCPLCKRRFSSILRPAKPPVFPSDRLIHVPVRDQVYHYLGNATVAPFDPYTEAKCSICHSSGDENLLLLCDLCDSAAHTYCVGLGATVPEGDWFCHECILSRDEHNKAEIDNSSNLNDSPSNEEHVSVFDIVRDPWNIMVERSSANQMLVNIARDDDACSEDDLVLSCLRRQERTMRDTTKLAGRTLRQCRYVHDRIQALRDNWDSIRNGSLSFSSRKDNGHTPNNKSENCVNSGKSSSSPCSSQKMKPVDGGLTAPEISVCSGQSSSTSRSSAKGKTVIGCPVTISNGDSREISKAWKMMDIAKSVEKRRSTLSLSSKNLSSGIKKGKNFDSPSGGKNQNLQNSQMLERQHFTSLGCKNNRADSVISPTPINCQLISPHNVQHPVQLDFRNGSDQSSPEKISFQSPFSASNLWESSTATSLVVEPATATSNSFHARLEVRSLSSSKKETSIAKNAEENTPIFPNAVRNNDAKSEI